MESNHDKTFSAISIDLTQIIVSIPYIHMSIQVLTFCDSVTFVLACITLIVFWNLVIPYMLINFTIFSWLLFLHSSSKEFLLLILWVKHDKPIEIDQMLDNVSMITSMRSLNNVHSCKFTFNLSVAHVVDKLFVCATCITCD
jgi:hypothetical protein